MTDGRLQALYQEALAASSSLGTGECPTPDRLQALVVREGSEDDRLATLDHALSCAACAHDLELLRVLRAASPTARRPHVAGRWLLAASAVIAVTAGALVLRTTSRSGQLVRGEPSGAGITLLAPEGDGPLLRWHAVPRVVSYAVEVLDSQGAVVAADTTRDTMFVVPASARGAAASTYQWWVRARLADGSELRSALEPLRPAR